MSSADATPFETPAAVSQPNAPAAAEQSAAAESTNEQLRSALSEANDRVLRAQAELENFRKRARREMEDERKYAALPLLKDMLSVLDNLQRAMEAAEKTQGASALLDGVKMVAMQMSSHLEQQGCKRIPAIGATFNPHLHEALAQEPSAEHAAGVVSRETSAGYQLHDRVVRPAQVFVSTGPPT